MRLHALRVCAFGPFASAQEVDFDDLGAGGLFLVNGATGSGKTSVLDAVCFALFADVPGARSARGVRSDLAAPEVATSVTLEFTCSGRRLRVTRAPEQLRPKRRGTGTVKSPASVLLEELRGGCWTVRSTRLDEAADVIADAVGLGLAQFQRIALLPQGEFAAFLRADARDRHRLLTALFDVAAFEDAETWLAEQRREAGAARELAERELDYGVRSLTDLLSDLPGETLDLPDPQVPLADLEPGEWASLAPVISGQLRSAAATAGAHLDQARDADTRAQRDLATAEASTVIRDRGERALAERERLTAQSTRIAAARDRVEAGLRAEPLRPQLHALTRAESTRSGIRADLAVAERDLAALGVPADLADRSLGERLATGARVLAAASAPARELAGASARTCAAERHVADCRARLATVDARAHAAQRRVAELVADLAEASGAADAVVAARASDGIVAEAQALAATLLESDRIRSLLRRRELTAAQAAVEAERALLALERARLADQAAALAAELAAGRPCPVCGACEHPDPARAAAAWSPTAIATAQRALTTAGEQLADIRLDLRGGQERAAAATARLADLGFGAIGPADAAVHELDRVRADSARALADAEAFLAHANRLAAEVEEARAAAETVAGEQREARAAVEIAVAAGASLRQGLAAAAADCRNALAAHAHCPCVATATARGRTDHAATPTSVTAAPAASAPVDQAAADESVAGLLAEVSQRHERVEAVVGRAAALRERAAAADEAALAAESDLAAALPPSGFPDRAAAVAALVPPEEARGLSGLIDDHARRAAVAADTLADPAVVAALRADPPAVEALRVRAAGLRDAAAHAARVADGLDRIARAAAGSLAAVVRAADEVRMRRERQLRIGALADLAAGTSPDNVLRMRLSTFVLAARLERVVELANERLSAMGEGRFQLGHDDSLAGHGARSGLGLLIRDEWSGAERSPASLSGGESFMASVALALGLADALRESAGGIELQSLFIDEGFGSLDEDSLEDVMGVLDGLRDGGRAVGVVSHLAELRDRIPSRLTVHKSSSGSDITQTRDLAAGA